MLITIDRSKWSRGVLRSNALLVGRQIIADGDKRLKPPTLGTMCCLGFVCKELGLHDDDIRDRPMPGDVPGIQNSVLVECGESTTFSNDAQMINDDIHRTEEERERNLTALFNDNGLELQFI